MHSDTLGERNRESLSITLSLGSAAENLTISHPKLPAALLRELFDTLKASQVDANPHSEELGRSANFSRMNPSEPRVSAAETAAQDILLVLAKSLESLSRQVSQLSKPEPFMMTPDPSPNRYSMIPPRSDSMRSNTSGLEGLTSVIIHEDQILGRTKPLALKRPTDRLQVIVAAFRRHIDRMFLENSQKISNFTSKLTHQLSNVAAFLIDCKAKTDQLTNINQHLLMELGVSQEQHKTIESLNRQLQKESERAEEAEEKVRDMNTQLFMLNSQIEISNKLKKKLEKQILMLEEEGHENKVVEVDDFALTANDFVFGSKLKPDLNVIAEADEFDSDNEGSILYKTSKLIKKKMSSNSIHETLRRTKQMRSFELIFVPSRPPIKFDRMVQVNIEPPRESHLTHSVVPGHRQSSSWQSCEIANGMAVNLTAIRASTNFSAVQPNLSAEPEFIKKPKKTNLFSTENIRKSIYDLQKEKETEAAGTHRSSMLPATPKSQAGIPMETNRSAVPRTAREEPTDRSRSRLYKACASEAVLAGSDDRLVCAQAEVEKLKKQKDELRVKLAALLAKIGDFGHLNSTIAALEEKLQVLSTAAFQAATMMRQSVRRGLSAKGRDPSHATLQKGELDELMLRRESKSTANLKKDKKTDKRLQNASTRKLFFNKELRSMWFLGKPYKDDRLTDQKALDFLRKFPSHSLMNDNLSHSQKPVYSITKKNTMARVTEQNYISMDPNVYESYGHKRGTSGTHKKSANNSQNNSQSRQLGPRNLLLSEVEDEPHQMVTVEQVVLESDKPSIWEMKQVQTDALQSNSKKLRTLLVNKPCSSAQDRKGLIETEKKQKSKIADFTTGESAINNLLKSRPLRSKSRRQDDEHRPNSIGLKKSFLTEFKSDQRVRMLKESIEFVVKELISNKRRSLMGETDIREEGYAPVCDRMHSLITLLKTASGLLEKELFSKDEARKKPIASNDLPERREPKPALAIKQGSEDDKRIARLAYVSNMFKFKKNP